MPLVTLCWKVCVRMPVFCTITRVHIYKVSYFVFFVNHNEVETKPGRHTEERLAFVFNLSAAGFRLLSDLHIAEQGACRALRAGSLIVEGKKNLAGIQTGERSALLIIMSSLQVSRLTVGGGGGGGDNRRADKE